MQERVSPVVIGERINDPLPQSTPSYQSTSLPVYQPTEVTKSQRHQVYNASRDILTRPVVYTDLTGTILNKLVYELLDTTNTILI